MPGIRREQYAPMNMHHQLYPLEYFLKTQRDLGVKTIELWAGGPHFYVDDHGFSPNYREIRKMIETGISSMVLHTDEGNFYETFPENSLSTVINREYQLLMSVLQK